MTQACVRQTIANPHVNTELGGRPPRPRGRGYCKAHGTIPGRLFQIVTAVRKLRLERLAPLIVQSRAKCN